MARKAAYVQEIENAIDVVNGRVKKYRNLEWNEYKTRYYLIDPMLRALGWDLEDPAQVLVEDSMVNGDRPDYKFYSANVESPLMVVEAKSIDKNDIGYILGEIEDAPEDIGADWAEWPEKLIGQLSGYVVGLERGYAVLTNGIAWCIWDLSKVNHLAQRTWTYHEWCLDVNKSEVAEVLKILHRRNLR